MLVWRNFPNENLMFSLGELNDFVVCRILFFFNEFFFTQTSLRMHVMEPQLFIKNELFHRTKPVNNYKSIL